MGILFQKAKLHSVLENHLNTIRDEIQSMDFKEFEKNDLEYIVVNFSNKYAIETPVLLYDNAVKSEPEEIIIDSRGVESRKNFAGQSHALFFC